MIAIGVDAHKRVHVAVALDDRGHVLGEWKGANSPGGWNSFLDWCTSSGPDRQVGIEGAWNLGRGLAQFLVERGESVFAVNSRWTALGRKSARSVGKTDVLDANAVAYTVIYEAGSLPRVTADDVTVVLDLLVSERQSSSAFLASEQRTRLCGFRLMPEPDSPSMVEMKGECITTGGGRHEGRGGADAGGV